MFNFESMKSTYQKERTRKDQTTPLKSFHYTICYDKMRIALIYPQILDSETERKYGCN